MMMSEPWREVMNEVQYLGGGFVFLVGSTGWFWGLPFERGTYVMVWGLGFAMLAYMRMRLRADPKERG
jgi:hypothetical protein